MKILYITAYPLEYSSSANIRNWGLIEGLIANGHKIFTLSPYPTDRSLFSGKIDTHSFTDRYWIGKTAKEEENRNEKNNKLKQKLKKIIFDCFNYISAYDRRRLLTRQINAKLIKETFDVIISSSDPKSSHLFAQKLIKQKPSICGKWIQYWGDPFANDISYGKLFGNYFVNRAEKRILRYADKIVYVSPFTTKELKKKYPQYSNKIMFLPIPYRLTSTYTNNLTWERPLVGYYGDYSSKNRNIIPFYQALKLSIFNAKIVGNSDIQLNSTENIKIEHRIPSDELQNIVDKTNIFVCICNLSGTQIPGKIYHYVNSGRPIVIILDGDKIEELREYFESFNRFYLCENTAESITECLNKVFHEKKVFDVPSALSPITIAETLIS